MKINSSLILKPNTVLKAKKINFNDPIVKQIINDSLKRQQQILHTMPNHWNQRQWQKLKLVINI